MIAEPRASFVRDLKKRGMNPEEREVLRDFLNDLTEGVDLVDRYGEHELIDDWAGYLECHLADDWLVIYRRFRDRVVLYRTGTHKELFDHVLKR